MEMSTINLRPYSRRVDREHSVWHMGHLFSFLARSEDTNGQFAVLEVLGQQGFEPPLHTHSRDDEAFYVLEGEIEFRAGDKIIPAGPGSFVFLPRGVAHTFQFRTARTRMLIVTAPAGLEAAFSQLSEPAQTLGLPPVPPAPPDLPRFMQVFGEVGVTFAPPPSHI